VVGVASLHHRKVVWWWQVSYKYGCFHWLLKKYSSWIQNWLFQSKNVNSSRVLTGLLHMWLWFRLIKIDYICCFTPRNQ
jgi:hypothetical protein